MVVSKLVAVMRYFPDDALIPFREEDLKTIGRKHGVKLSLEEVAGTGQKILPGGVLCEETREIPIEAATQSVVTLEGDSSEGFRRCVRELIDTYRGPVPIWGLWGSTAEAEDIVNDLLDENDGW